MNIKFTTEQKEKISAMLLKQAEESGMPKQKYAISVGLSGSDFSNLEKENWKENTSLVGDRKWLTMARIVGFEKNEHLAWKIAHTEVFDYVYNSLATSKDYAVNAILVDIPGIGKTCTAKYFIKQHKNAFYMNCSNAQSKREFMGEFSRCVGVANNGKLKEQFKEAIYLLSQLETPIVILDEVGDLDNSAMLLIKQICNQLEGICGIYLIGSDGLKSKIIRGIKNNTQGFTEVFSRFGKKYNKALLCTEITEQKRKMQQMSIEVCKANGITNKEEITEILKKLVNDDGLGDLRVIEREIKRRKILTLKH